MCGDGGGSEGVGAGPQGMAQAAAARGQDVSVGPNGGISSSGNAPGTEAFDREYTGTELALRAAMPGGFAVMAAELAFGNRSMPSGLSTSNPTNNNNIGNSGGNPHRRSAVASTVQNSTVLNGSTTKTSEVKKNSNSFSNFTLGVPGRLGVKRNSLF